MSRWKLHKGRYVKETISMEIPVFNQLQRQANLGKLFDTITHEDKQFILRLIEKMANIN